MKNIIKWLIFIMLGILAILYKTETYGHFRPILIVATFVLAFPDIYKHANAYPFKYMLALYIWLFLSYFVASNKAIASFWIEQCALTLFVCLSFFAIVWKRKYIPIAYLVFIVVSAVIADYIYSNRFQFIYDIGEKRMMIEGINTNTPAYFLFYFTFIIYILGDIVKKVNISKFLKIAFFFIIPLSFYVAILTASRQVLLIQVPFISLLIFVRYSVKSSRIIILTILLGIAAFILLPQAIDIYGNSLLAERNQEALSEDARTTILKKSFEIGFANFFTGVGLGNLVARIGAIAHNSYLELFADTGIVGMLIYVFFTFGFVRRQFRRYKCYKDKMYLSFMMFGIFFIFDNFFFVFYSDYWLMSFYVLVVCHAETYYCDNHKMAKNQIYIV